MASTSTPATHRIKTVNLTLLAHDIATAFDRVDHPLPEHIGIAEIERALPVFLIALGLNVDGSIHGADPHVDQAAAADPFLRHVCNPAKPGKPLPYGRKAPEGECPRCDQLRDGAEARPAPMWLSHYEALKTSDADRAAEIKAHFAPGGEHERKCKLSPITTCYDW
jgi:hypothetical protein